jgi:peptidoglycan/LPS O-acetylase OafA/YrhL
MVLLGHLVGTAGLPVSWLPFAWGGLGVTVFFVISGYLITSLLLKEQDRTGTISLRMFYFRRTLRIFPAMYVFVAVVVALGAMGVLAGAGEPERTHLGAGDILAAATYTMNFRVGHSWWLGHTWSLAVEEQFYLLWPAAVVYLGIAGGLRWAIGAMLVAPLFRVIFYFGWPHYRSLVEQAFPFVFDALATGCVLAMLRRQLWADRRYRAVLESRLFALVPVIVGVTYSLNEIVGPSLLVGTTVINVGIAMCIDWAMRFPDSRAGRLLNSRPLVWVGVISYSLYLWQQLFLCRYHTGWFTTFPVNLGLAFAAAIASYYVVEQPFLRLRERLEARLRPRSATPKPELRA